MVFDLSGRIILQDVFSAVFAKLENETRAAEGELGNLGTKLDASAGPAKARIAALGAEVDRLQQKARTGQAPVLPAVNPAQYTGAAAGLAATATNSQSAAAGLLRMTGIGQMAGSMFGTVGLNAGMLTGALGAAGVAGAVAIAAAAIAKLAGDLGVLGMQSRQVEARFVAFSGGAGQAAVNFQAMDQAVSGALTRDEKMAAVSRVMGLELAKNADQAAQITEAALVLGDAEANAQSRIESFTQMLVSGQTRGLAQFGISVQVVKEHVKELMSANVLLTTQQATQQAIMEAATQKMTDVKREGGSAATAVTELSNAWADLKDAAGDKVVLIVEPRVKDATNVVKAITASIEKVPLSENEKNLIAQRVILDDVTNRLVNAENNLKDAQATGNVDYIAAMQSEVTAYQQWQDAINKILAPLQQQAAMEQALASRKSGAYQRIDEIEQLTNASSYFTKELERAAAADDAFQESLRGVTEKATGIAALAGQVGELAGLLKTTQTGVPVVPKVGTLLGTDVTAVREYLSTVAQINPALAQVIAEASRSVDTFAAQQQAVLASAAAMSNHAAALETIARAVFGADASIGDLVSKFDQLPPPVQQAVLDLGLLETALGRVQGLADKPIEIDVLVNGLESALSDIDRMALRLTGVLDPTAIRAFRDQARTEVASHWQSMEGLDAFGMELQKDVILKGYDDIINGTVEHYRAIEGATKQHYTNLADSAAGLKSQIEGALKMGLEVTPEQMTASKAGTYTDQALESARRLQAIAERGLAELKIHPDWAAALKIPPEVLSGTEDALKSWASRTKADVVDLARPDLINWNAFIVNFKAQADREAAKGLTIDIAVNKLNEAGMLQGLSKEEQRKKVAQALGIGVPELTIDALFAPKGTAGDLVTKFLGDKKEVEIPARFVFPAGPQPMGAPYNDLLPPGSVPFPTPAQPPAPLLPTPTAPPTARRMGGAAAAEYELASVGAQTITPNVSFNMEGVAYEAMVSFADHFSDAMKERSFALQVATTLDTDFSKNSAAFGTIGTGAGKAVGTAFGKAITENVGDIRTEIAVLLAPEVAAILARQQRGKSSAQ